VISRLFALLVSLKFFTSLEMSRVCANLEPATSLQAQPDDATIATIERLLAAIDRLRVERDDLRRDVQFLETESRFAIESLEAKLSASVSTVTSRGAMEVTQSRRIVERSALVATASAVVIRHLDFRYSQLQEELRITQNQCADWQSQLQVKNQTIEQQTDKIHALEVQLGVSMSNLHGLCKQRDDIESNFTQRELQWEEERQRINRLNQNNLEELGRQVQELSRTLENVEYISRTGDIAP
jgi:chromosome segregation ATPase